MIKNTVDKKNYSKEILNLNFKKGFSDCTSYNVRVIVNPEYLEEDSNPESKEYYFKYSVKMINLNPFSITLKSRYWQVINSEGDETIIKGPGVIGQTPQLANNEEFNYSSYCILNSQWGTMEGFYFFETDDKKELKVQIARFYLLSKGHL